MTEAEKKNLIENYVRAYNEFDVEKMIAGLHDDVLFVNVSGNETTHEIKGAAAFKEQAERAAGLFAEREQTIKKFACGETECEIEIEYRATLAADLPNGMKTGDRIEIGGKSIFRFAGGKIVEIRDIS